MKKIAFIVATLMMITTAADAKGFRIPRFKSPSFSSKTVRPSVKPKTVPKPVSKASPKQNVETRTYRSSTPVRDRDDGGDSVSSFLSGAVGGVVGGVIYDGMTSEEQPEPIIQPIEKIEK